MGTRGNKWQEDEFCATGAREIDEILAQVKSIAAIAGGTALDFGCGIGRLSRAPARRYRKVVGIDISSSMVPKASELNADIENIEFVTNTEGSLNRIPSASIDFVYTNLTLQHIPPPMNAKFVRELYRVLAPNGLTVF